MGLRAALDWLLIAVCVLTCVLLAGEAVGILRRLLEFKRKVERFADLPVIAALPKAQDDAERLSAAMAAVAPLALRVAAAAARIRAAAGAAARLARLFRGP